MTLSNKANNAPNHDKIDQQQVDERFMRLALKQAHKAIELDEVPIGAIIVNKSGKIIANAHNLRETKHTTLGHAELVAIHRACQKLKSWRLLDCTLYVSLEPCFMCAGALVQARVGRVVFGAADPKGGALKSLASLHEHPQLNHQFKVTAGVLENECSDLLKKFFKNKRKKT